VIKINRRRYREQLIKDNEEFRKIRERECIAMEKRTRIEERREDLNNIRETYKMDDFKKFLRSIYEEIKEELK